MIYIQLSNLQQIDSHDTGDVISADIEIHILQLAIDVVEKASL
jgi:hypothetical protein